MSGAMIKNFFREIKHSFGRFFSIMCIIALGVGFFAGLKTARADMIKTADRYLAEHKMYDYRLLNTLGFDDGSIAAARAEGYAAEGAYSLDAVMNYDGSDAVYKLHSVPEEINTLSVVYGRLPENENECAADRRYFGEQAIGQKMALSDAGGEDAEKALRGREYTIVGIVNSPIYLNYERGTTALLDGSIRAFLYLPRSAFAEEYYTELYIRLGEDYEIYSEEYEQYTDEREGSVLALSERLAKARYDRVVADATAEYDRGYREYSENLKKYERERARAYAELDEAKEKLSSASRELDENQRKYDAGLKEYTRNRAQYDKGVADLKSGIAALNAGIEETQDLRDRLSAALGGLQAAGGSSEEIAALSAQLAQAESALSALSSQKAELENTLSETTARGAELSAAKKELDGAKQQLDSGRARLDRSKDEYTSAKTDADEKFGEAKAKLDTAAQELDEAKKEIEDIAAPESFSLGRDTNIGYVCFENDSGIVDGLAEVFPLFFFLVAALMCMTTMTRMISESRTDIGVMKALGYSRAAIMAKYIAYSGLAAVLGTALGFFGGSYLFPQAIWMAYTIMYGFAPLEIIYDPVIAPILLIAALICTCGATVLSCRRELSLCAAQLMRPKAPAGGKHGFFEKLRVFRRMNFLRKVSVRNLTRYKQRLFMMVIGVAGCTALLITGFGISDSIQKICDYQYGEILTYDFEVMLEDGLSPAELTEFAARTSYAGKAALAHTLSYNAATQNGDKSVQVIACTDNLDGYIDLHSGKTELPFPKDGEAVVSRKFAETNGMTVGGEISLSDADRKTVSLKIVGLCDNYVYNYVYTTARSLESGLGYAPAVNTAFIKLADVSGGEAADVHALGARLMNEAGVRSVTVTGDLIERVSGMLDSVDYIVLLVILCAGALAFVVIYNLTNINITERRREIATIKVLGFYPGETAMYVFGENFVLTALGALLGIPLGRLLHLFVMSKINIDMVSFDVKVTALSVVFSVVLTFVFSVAVDFLMYFKLQKIDMAQSLKSVE